MRNFKFFQSFFFKRLYKIDRNKSSKETLKFLNMADHVDTQFSEGANKFTTQDTKTFGGDENQLRKVELKR